MADLDALREQLREKKKVRSNLSTQSPCSSSQREEYNVSKDAEYHYHLGQCYYNGLEGYKEDLQKAYEEFLKAAKLGHLHAMVEVGNDYAALGLSVLGYDIERARMWGNKALEKGNVDGYDVLASCMEEGEEEIRMLEFGISKGSQSCTQSMAQNLIYGWEYPDGHIVESDKERAFQLLKDIEWDKYHTYGLEMLGKLYREKENIIQAKNCYERILKLTPHDYSTMAILGDMFRTEESIKDFSCARKWLLKAANGGNLSAMNDYGVMLYLGEGMEPDVKAAVEWFKKSANSGSTQAMINLGDHYMEVDISEARSWFEKAREGGDSRGEERLQEMGIASRSVEASRSDKIYDNFLNNIENTLNMWPSTILNSGFPNRIGGIQKVIDKGDLSDYEADRLRILQAALSLMYFRHHFLDDNFSEYEDEYYKILDAIDDYVGAMSVISDEGLYIYFIANMYSADRFKDIDAEDKLEELWTKLSAIELDEKLTEFKVSFWEEMAQEVYDLMSDLLCSNNSRDDIKDRVISIVADTLDINKGDVHTYSRLVQNLGADSLDAVDLIMKLENEFDLCVSDDDVRRMHTVGDIICYIETHN